MKASYLQRRECELEVQVGVVSLRVIVIMRHPVRAINGEHMSIVLATDCKANNKLKRQGCHLQEIRITVLFVSALY